MERCRGAADLGNASLARICGAHRRAFIIGVATVGQSRKFFRLQHIAGHSAFDVIFRQRGCEIGISGNR
jgi:hypothetical protein